MAENDPKDSATKGFIEEVVGANLALGQALLTVEVDMVAAILGLSAAMSPPRRPATKDRAEKVAESVEDQFDNMPV